VTGWHRVRIPTIEMLGTAMTRRWTSRDPSEECEDDVKMLFLGCKKNHLELNFNILNHFKLNDLFYSGVISSTSVQYRSNEAMLR
jgi:hypothetical protein